MARNENRDRLTEATQVGMKKQMISGMIWTIADIFGNQVAKLIVQIILARLLLPKDFGVISIISVFIALSQSLMDSGFQNALIREEKTCEEDLATVFYFNFFMSIVLYGALFFAAPSLSLFFHEPKLELILRVVGIILIINSFGLIQRTILSKQLKFKTQMIINMLSSIISGLIAIFCAFRGFGIWSLVIQTIVMQFLQASLFTMKNRWWPKTGFYWKSFKRLYKFGWKIMISGLLNTAYQNIYFVLIGRLYSASDLGYYTNAQKLRDAADFTITGAVRKVSYPALSKVKDQQEVLKRGYRKILRYTVFFTLPISLGLAVIAPQFFPVLFGTKWDYSIPYFQILCLAGIFFPLHAINLNILQVKGRSDLVLKLELINKGFAVALIVLSLIFHGGMMGLVWMSVLSSFVSYLINSYYSGFFLSYSTKNQIKDSGGSFISAILMAVMLLIFSNFIKVSGLGGVLLLSCSGFFSYLFCHILFQTAESKEIMNYVKQFVKHEVKVNEDSV